jgi:hypothetical protein
MNIIFPAYPGDPTKIDPSWEAEAKIAKDAGFEITLLSEGYFGSEMSIRNLPLGQTMYRGWILKPTSYASMNRLVNSKLLNTPENYLWSYEIPRWYPYLGKSTPESYSFFKEELEEKGVEYIAQQVGELYPNTSMILKDYLKSRKHEWFDACFIRDASDTNEVVRIVTNFVRLQGEDFHGGLVFRKFLNLKRTGIHPKSHMPLALEYRVFFLNQEPIFTTPYWTDGVYADTTEQPDAEFLREVGKKLCSPFVALDIAQDEDGKWWVIEVNDGGSAGLPDHVDLKQFYAILFKRLDDGETRTEMDV